MSSAATDPLTRLTHRARALPGRTRRQVERAHYRWRALGMVPKGGVGVEVGVWRGDNAVRLLKRTRPRQLYLIDPWEHRPEGRGWYGARSSQAAMDEVCEAVRARFADDARVEVRRARSLDFRSEDLGGRLLDWAYIDGDHAYEGVSADLEHYASLVRPGGYLLGDDYGLAGRWWGDGVTRAVDEFVAGHGYELTLIGTQFLIRR